MSVRQQVYSDPAAAAEHCALHITTLIEETLSGNDFATIAISGGSTPKLLYGQLVRRGVEWKRVHVFWVDERCVPITHEQSNFRMADEYLIGPGRIPARNLHRIHGEMQPSLAAGRYVEEIEEFFRLEEGELPHFDLVHLGMGADAHTASLFPGEPLISNRDQIAAAVYVDKLASSRVTLLPGTLMNAKHTVFLVAGADKADAVNSVFEKEYDPLQYPAQMASHHGRRVAWFLDTAAAARLE